MDEYRYECQTLKGFLARVVLLSRWYPYFVSGTIREGRAPELVDEKLLAKYSIRKTRRQRHYLREKGRANGHYIRFGRYWVVMATERDFFLSVDNKEVVSDLRLEPYRLEGYSISRRRDGSALREGEHRLRASVRLDRETYLELRAHFLYLSVHRTADVLAADFWKASSGAACYAPIYRQWVSIWKRVNEKRKAAGFERVPLSCIRRFQPAPRHFGGQRLEDEAA